jgi:diguanylate cyclase (GGDEF)-like protein
LALLATVVCLLTSLAAVNMFQRSRVAGGGVGLAWILTAGVGTGYGIWSTHFIAMLAYNPGFAFDYDLWLTAVSLVVAALMTSAGLVIAAYAGRRWGVMGGVVIGVGIACMHFMGMASLNFVVIWDRDLIAVSILLGVALSVAAVTVAQRAESRAAIGAAAFLLTLAITSHHFVAMGAIGFIPPLAPAAVAGQISPIGLCLAIATITAAMVAASMFGAAVDRSTHRRITVRNMQLDVVLNNTGQGLCLFDADNRLQLWNELYVIMYRLRPDDLRIGCSIEDMLALRGVGGTVPDDIDLHRLRLHAAIVDRTPASWMTALPDGRSILVSFQPLADGGWLATHEDHTERLLSRARIEHLAYYDGMTDLPNRAMFDRHLDQAISEAKLTRSSFAAVCIDLDRFKDINDMYGHAGGDEFLCEVARRLQRACGESFAARVGGDEFIVISADGVQPAAVEALCAQIAAAFEWDFFIKGALVRGSCTMGVAIYPDNGSSAEELVANADAALYRAKSDLRGSIRFFQSMLDNGLREKRILHMEMIGAIERDEFEPYFQPQAAADGDIIGFEVLVRWQHPAKGLVPPAMFIPLAEETGLIADIDRLVLRAACREAATWSKRLSIAVNLSPVDFRRGDVAAMILEVLCETGLQASRLHVEITEGVLMEDFDRATAQLRKIKNLGVHLAMDDFGTGYSSMSYLQAFPFDKIKIDRTFVMQLGLNPQSGAIVGAIIALGRSLGLTVIAEGVETAAQREILIQQGCDELQGYLIGRPKPISAYQHLVSDHHPISHYAAAG